MKVKIIKPTWMYWAFVVFYILDAITTIIGYNSYNEFNPLVRTFIDNVGYTLWIVLKVLLAFFIGAFVYLVQPKVCTERTKRILFALRISLLLLTIAVVINNIIVIILL